MTNKPPIPPNEAERLEAVGSYELMGTPPESDFDDIARIASQLCGTSVALVTLVGKDRQWFKAHHGTEETHTPRDIAFCSYAILEPNRPLVVPDARLDDRFRHNPLVTGPMQVVFYAGVPLVNPEGHALGTLCVIDHKPHRLGDDQLKALATLASTTAQLFELRRKVRWLEASKRQLEDLNQEVSEMAYVMSHDLKSPLNSLVSLLGILKEENGDQLDEGGREILDLLHGSALNLNNIAKGTVEYFNSTKKLERPSEAVDMSALIGQLVASINPPAWVSIECPPHLPSIVTSKVAMYHILLNLLDNAIKYNDKQACAIRVEFAEKERSYEFAVADNGPGIEPQHSERVFKLFQTLGRMDRQGNAGTGLGLAIVRRMVKRLGGDIAVSASPEGGARFVFSVEKQTASNPF